MDEEGGTNIADGVAAHHEEMAGLNRFWGRAGRYTLTAVSVLLAVVQVVALASEGLLSRKVEIAVACFQAGLGALVATCTGTSEVRAKTHRSRARGWRKAATVRDPYTTDRMRSKDARRCAHDRALQRFHQKATTRGAGGRIHGWADRAKYVFWLAFGPT